MGSVMAYPSWPGLPAPFLVKERVPTLTLRYISCCRLPAPLASRDGRTGPLSTAPPQVRAKAGPRQRRGERGGSPGSPRASLDHALRPQVGNGRLVVSEAPQDRCGVLAEGRGTALDGTGGLRQPYWHLGDGRRLRRAREVGCLEEAHGVDVRILKGLLRLE